MLKRSVLSVTLFWLASLAPAADVPLYDLGTFTRPITVAAGSIHAPRPISGCHSR